MKNYIQDGNTITLTAPYNVDSGDGLLVNALFGVAATSGLAGEETETVMEGVFELPKADAQQIAQGGALYWDDTNKLLTTTATDNFKVGAATKDAGPAETTVVVRLSGVTG